MNGYAPWGEVTKITYPDKSWIAYVYQDGSDGVSQATGWVTEQITPFKDDSWAAGDGDEAGNVEQEYSYDASVSGNGQAADPMNLVEQPREVISSVVGITTGITYIRVGGTAGTPVVGTENALNLLTRTATIDAMGNITPWATSVFQTATTIAAAITNGYETTTTGPSGKSDVQVTSSAGTITASDTESYMGNTVASSQSVTNPEGYDAGDTDAEVGDPYDSTADGNLDAYGEYGSETDQSSGITTNANYVNSSGARNWFGPASATQADGSTTDYQYNALGEVSVKTIFAGTSDGVLCSYTYDLAGHIASLKTTAVESGRHRS